MKIYKYPINLVGPTKIELPVGSTILSAGAQGEQLVVWAEVPEIWDTATRVVESVMTGGEPPYGRFIGTVAFAQAAFIVHVYEVLP